MKGICLLNEMVAAEPSKIGFDASWYLETGGKVRGPLAPFELVALKNQLSPNSRIKVSKKGLLKWHNYSDLFELVESAYVLNEKICGEKITPILSELLPLSSPKKIYEPKTEETVKPEPSAKSFFEPIQPTIPWERILADATMGQVTEENLPFTNKIQQKTPNLKEIKKANLALRGRLRLGQITSPIRLASVDIATSLCFSIPTWFDQAFRDLHWHLFNNHDFRNMPQPSFILIPGLHFYSFLVLAKNMQAVERQHSYVKTSLRKTFFLAIFPPFAVFYLQRQLNKHWIGHIRMALKNMSGDIDL